jgi:hypothetical protein
MRSSLVRSWLMASTSIAVLSATPALAQQDSACAQKLDRVQQSLQQADVPEQRRSDVQLVIDGARTLAETGDEQGCERVSAELDQLMQTITETGTQTAQAGSNPQAAQQESQSGHQVGEADTESLQGQEQTAQAEQTPQEQQAADQGAKAQQQPADQDQQTAQDQQPTGGQGEQAAEGEAEMTAKLTIEQPQPQVTVHQQAPKVTVHIPKPIITIRMPPPQVDVRMPDPDVQVEVPEPEIRVSMAQPDLQVEGAQGRAQGQQTDQDQQIQAKVDYQGSERQQAQVDVQMEQPEVRVEQSEPQIDVARGGPEDQQAGQQQAAVQQAPDEANAPMQQERGQRAQTGKPAAGESGPKTGQMAEATDEAPTDKAQPGSTSADSPLAHIPASDLLGSDVVNDQGDTVAEIVDMVKQSDSDQLLAVLSVGGFLGIGEKEVAMPLDRFQVGADQQIILSNASEDELEDMPAWDADKQGYESLRQ